MKRKQRKIRTRIFAVLFLFVLGLAGSNFFVNDIDPVQHSGNNILSAAENPDGEISDGTQADITPTVDEKICYLTFDDGPSLNTEKVLDILYQYGVKATFFVTGKNPDCDYLIARAYREGHSIGLHTYSHDYSLVYKSTENYYDDLKQVSDRVYNLTGTRPDIIRFPGGSSNTVSRITPGIMTELSAEVENVGYNYFDWNVSSGDAVSGGLSKEQIVKEIERGSAGKDQICVLMHDSIDKVSTVEALTEIIEMLKNEGYTFKGLSRNSYGFHHRINN